MVLNTCLAANTPNDTTLNRASNWTLSDFRSLRQGKSRAQQIRIRHNYRPAERHAQPLSRSIFLSLKFCKGVNGKPEEKKKKKKRTKGWPSA